MALTNVARCCCGRDVGASSGAYCTARPGPVCPACAATDVCALHHVSIGRGVEWMDRPTGLSPKMRAVIEKVDAAEAQAHAVLRERAAQDSERRRAVKRKIPVSKRPRQPPLARS